VVRRYPEALSNPYRQGFYARQGIADRINPLASLPAPQKAGRKFSPPRYKFGPLSATGWDAPRFWSCANRRRTVPPRAGHEQNELAEAVGFR